MFIEGITDHDIDRFFTAQSLQAQGLGVTANASSTSTNVSLPGPPPPGPPVVKNSNDKEPTDLKASSPGHYKNEDEAYKDPYSSHVGSMEGAIEGESIRPISRRMSVKRDRTRRASIDSSRLSSNDVKRKELRSWDEVPEETFQFSKSAYYDAPETKDDYMFNAFEMHNEFGLVKPRGIRQTIARAYGLNSYSGTKSESEFNNGESEERDKEISSPSVSFMIPEQGKTSLYEQRIASYGRKGSMAWKRRSTRIGINVDRVQQEGYEEKNNKREVKELQRSLRHFGAILSDMKVGRDEQWRSALLLDDNSELYRIGHPIPRTEREVLLYPFKVAGLLKNRSKTKGKGNKTKAFHWEKTAGKEGHSTKHLKSKDGKEDAHQLREDTYLDGRMLLHETIGYLQDEDEWKGLKNSIWSDDDIKMTMKVSC